MALGKSMALEVRGCYTSESSCPSRYTEGRGQEQTLLCCLQNGGLPAPSYGTG